MRSFVTHKVALAGDPEASNNSLELNASRVDVVMTAGVAMEHQGNGVTSAAKNV